MKNWKLAHTFWALVAGAAEPAIEALQGQQLNKATLWHAAGVFAVAMVMLLVKSPLDTKSETPPTS